MSAVGFVRGVLKAFLLDTVALVIWLILGSPAVLLLTLVPPRGSMVAAYYAMFLWGMLCTRGVSALSKRLHEA